MRHLELIFILFLGGVSFVLSSDPSSPLRSSRVNLVQRRANELERDARIRYSEPSASAEDIVYKQEVIEQCLDAFRTMISDIVQSSCLVRQLEQVAGIIDNVNMVGSLPETFTSLVMDVLSILKIEVGKYTAIFASGDKGVFIARLLQLAARIGLSRDHIKSIFSEVNLGGNHKERIEELEREVALFVQNSQSSASSLVMSLLNLSPLESLKKNYRRLLEVPYETETLGFETSLSLLFGNDFKVEDGGDEEVWELLFRAHKALRGIPRGLMNVTERTGVYASALKDLQHADLGRINKAKNKLEYIIIFTETFAEDVHVLFAETRSQLGNKIRDSLPEETKLIFEPLLLQFVNEYLNQLLSYKGENRMLDEFSRTWLPIQFLEIQIDGFLQVINAGDARISLSEFLSSQVDRSVAHEHMRFLTVKISYEFASRFGIDLVAKRRDMFKDRLALLTQLIAAYQNLGDLSPIPNNNVLETLPDEQLSLMVERLSRIVAWREEYLSRLNQDPPLGLDAAEEWNMAMLQGHKDSWKGWLYLEKMTNLGFPDRILHFAQRMQSLHRQYRRRFGGLAGITWNALFKRASIQLPEALVRLEIQLGGGSLGLRERLETLFLKFADLLEIAGEKYKKHNNSLKLQRILSDLTLLNLVPHNLQIDADSLKGKSFVEEDSDYILVDAAESFPAHFVDLTRLENSSAHNNLAAEEYAELVDQLCKLSARIELEKNALLA